jgi:hypothetical protein
MSVAKDAVNLSSLTGRQHWLQTADWRETSFVGEAAAFSFRAVGNPRSHADFCNLAENGAGGASASFGFLRY